MLFQKRKEVLMKYLFILYSLLFNNEKYFHHLQQVFEIFHKRKNVQCVNILTHYININN